MIALIQNWGVLVLRGLLSVVVGVFALSNPEITVQALVLLYITYAFVDGIFCLWLAFRKRIPGASTESLVGMGVLGIAVGILGFFWPMATLMALIYTVAAWSIIVGVLELSAAVQLRKTIRNEWLLAASGMLSILFGVGLMLVPIAGVLILAATIGIYAIVHGVMLISLGLRTRATYHRPPQIRVAPNEEHKLSA